MTGRHVPAVRCSFQLLTKWAAWFSKRPDRFNRELLARVLQCPFCQEFLSTINPQVR